MLALLGTAPSGATAQGASRESISHVPRAATAIRAAELAVDAVRIDGGPTEDIWRGITPVSGFVQSEPAEGLPASEGTDVRVAYDADRLYVRATMHDREPNRAVVNDIRKDFKEDDQDTFELILDTFGDKRNGYLFATNIEGAKADRQVADEGREVNASWDAVWTVRTWRHEDGWTAEFAIPFSSLRFDPKSQRAWGINFSRRIRRRNEIDFWAPIPRAFKLTRLSLAGTLTGVRPGAAGRDLRVKPYLLANTVRGIGEVAARGELATGADLKLGITRGLTLDVTVHPDFAQAEADEQQVNLTQFSQFLPEKREFFLENSGVFYVGDAQRTNRANPQLTPDEDLLLFFSRRIGLSADGRAIPLDGGVRLSGRSGPIGIGALVIGTQPTARTPRNEFGVFRLRRDLTTGSDVGMLFMTRQAAGNSRDYNRVYGADANMRLFGLLDWSSYLIRTETPGRGKGQYAARTSVNWEGNFFHGKAALMSIGEGFNDELGYFRRVGIKKWVADMGVRPRPLALRQYGVRELHPHITWDYFTDQSNVIVAKKLHTGFSVFLNNGGYWELSSNPMYQRIAAPFKIDPRIAPIPVGGYEWFEWMLRGQTDPSRSLALHLALITGGFWDGTQRTIQTTVDVRPDYHFRLSAGFQRTDARLRTPNANFIATLWTARTGYAFNTKTFVDALTQYDPRSRQMNANVRLNIIHHPLSDLFIVYNDQRVLTTDGPIPGRSLAVKVTQTTSF